MTVRNGIKNGKHSLLRAAGCSKKNVVGNEMDFRTGLAIKMFCVGSFVFFRAETMKLSAAAMSSQCSWSDEEPMASPVALAWFSMSLGSSGHSQ